MNHLKLYEEYFDNKVVTYKEMHRMLMETSRSDIREAVLEVLKKHLLTDKALEVDYVETVDTPEGKRSGVSQYKRMISLLDFSADIVGNNHSICKSRGYPFDLILIFMMKETWKDKKLMHMITVQGIDENHNFFLYVGNAESLFRRVYEILFFKSRKEVHKNFGLS